MRHITKEQFFSWKNLLAWMVIKSVYSSRNPTKNYQTHLQGHIMRHTQQLKKQSGIIIVAEGGKIRQNSWEIPGFNVANLRNM